MIIDIVKIVLYYAVQIYCILLIVYIWSGYFPSFRETRFYHFLYHLFDPVLEKLRFLRIGYISFAPLALFLLMQLFINLLLAVL